MMRKNSPMFLIMGMVHIVAGLVLMLSGSEFSLYASQAIGGLVMLSIGFYLFLQELDA